MTRIRLYPAYRSGMSMLCIVVFLFSYVNITMFWHGHSGSGYRIFHSHVAGAAHRAAPVEKAHTPEEWLLIQSLDLVSLTDDVLPVIELAPFRLRLETLRTEAESFSGFQGLGAVALRGPPALV